jgi:hypothetical protein
MVEAADEPGPFRFTKPREEGEAHILLFMDGEGSGRGVLVREETRLWDLDGQKRGSWESGRLWRGLRLDFNLI